MATPLLITRADFSGRVELSANMADAKINNRILEAQDFDLRDLMGDAFYWSFVGATSEPLLSGGDYTYKEITYTFYGIKPVIVYYATSRLIKNLDLHFTPNGVMQKRNDFSDHIESKDLSWRANQFINQGLSYWNMCRDYLDRNPSEYPLWKAKNCFDEPTNKQAPKITALGGDGSNYYPNYQFIRRF